MENIAIIGAGISGMTAAHLLKEKKYNVTLFEKESTHGGLIQCKKIKGSLFHTCGGHVFNSKRQDVLEWFWNFFNKEQEFQKATRNSVVIMKDGLYIPYPIENYAYMYNEEMKIGFIKDLISLSKHNNDQINNFEDFLKNRFGETLYKNYFKPYNIKIWKRNLNKVPLSWLEGKLPMPTIEELIYNNINHVKEGQFVHSSFWYEKEGGSQFIADRLSNNLNIKYNQNIRQLDFKNQKWIINGASFEKIVFCGNIKDLPHLLSNNIPINEAFIKEIEDLEYHGTTSVFCEIDENPYSWIYLPSDKYLSHRIICTGNFSKTNNASNKTTATLEFTDYIPENDIMENIQKMPLSPKYITHHYTPYSYPIQNTNTRSMINHLKTDLSKFHFYLTGRFADWEYYNMDTAIGAAMDMVKKNFSMN